MQDKALNISMERAALDEAIEQEELRVKALLHRIEDAVRASPLGYDSD
jgi:hypothetical protein